MTADGFKPPSYYNSQGGPSPLLIAVIAGILVVAVGVIMAFLFKLGPFADAPSSPSASAGPTVSAAPSALQTHGPTTEPSPGSTSSAGQQPTESPASGPTDAATAAPTTPPTVGPSPGDALAQLLIHVPEAIRSSCTPGSFAAPVAASVNCASTDGIAVDYALYDEMAAMRADYDQLVDRAQIEPESGTCYEQNPDGTLTATPDSWPSELLYSIADEEIGRYLCDPSGQGSITWTDERLSILSVASAPEGDLNQLVTFWVNEAGPVQ